MNRTVVITGGSRGIGKAAAMAFAEAGDRIALCSAHRADQLEETAEELRALRVPVFARVTDVGDFSDTAAFIAEAEKALGPADILVNNAGISRIGLLTDMTPEDWNAVISTNLTSCFNTCHAVVPGMVRRKKGVILNVSSVWGVVGASCEVAYSAAKGGMNAFTMALAKELAPSGIQVNAVACGAIDTEMNRFLSEEDARALSEEIPAGRMGTPDEVARFLLSLCENHAYLTGQVIRLDGGWI